ncbi:MAG: sulfatase-like hydrolase/transferase [Candidatus Cloacimonetes bacterium]|nr:sulfatase-like hydrolase/transferase [Candidatus Cloacimonadota bacterium]
MQTAFLILIIYLILALGSAIFIFWFLKRNRKKESKPAISLVFIISLLVILFLIIRKTEIHPLLSFFKTPRFNGSSFTYEIDESILVRKDKKQELPEHLPDSPVIVIMIESMRYDLINIEPCPISFMKSLIDQSYLFSKSYAASSHSDYADLSLWYSKYPLRSSKRTKYKKNSHFRKTSIFQVFKNLNYETAYISSHNEKWGSMINWLDVPEIDFFYHSEDYNKKTWYNKDDKKGLASLIKNKIATAGKIEDSETLRIAKDWIANLSDSKSFFLGMNLQNTHFNYLIPEGGEEPFQPSIIDFPMIYYSWSEEKVEHVKNRYFNAFYNLDMLINDFVDFLKKEGIWDNCYFIIIGDNGEAFYEHGFGNHSGPMYDESVRTFTLIKPLKDFITYPVENPINHIDILPAVLDLMNIPIPNSFQGISPFKTDLKRIIYLHANAIVHQDGIIDWPWKLLINYQPAKEAELYNLEIDPLEKRNLFNSCEKKANELFDKLMNWRNTQLVYYRKPQYHLIFEPPKIN